jgi:hypothetical protein
MEEAGLTEEIQAVILEPRLAVERPEIFHYTNEAGLGGIVQTQTLWATHYTNLNDGSEVRLLKEPLTIALTKRFAKVLIERRRKSLSLQMRVERSGGVQRAAREHAQATVEALYEVSFQGSGLTFAEPYVASFSGHDVGSYESSHGQLSQWRAYAGTDGYCIVLDTYKLGGLLANEFDRYYFLMLSLTDTVYADAASSVDDAFPVLLDRAEYFFRRLIDGGDLSRPVGDGFAPFLAAATQFKHQGFREENEVRIVAVRGTSTAIDRAKRDYPDFRPPPSKPVHTADGHDHQRRRIVLFDWPHGELPITRVIVGPSRNQAKNFERAMSLSAGRWPVERSEIPLVVG